MLISACRFREKSSKRLRHRATDLHVTASRILGDKAKSVLHTTVRHRSLYGFFQESDNGRAAHDLVRCIIHADVSFCASVS